ncbi:ShlB/FhaC/HecB family hemolysin secretion/activation protein [Limnohabitans sp. T6-5]|uniref:ShlB/FhaC/HecB family hemolysin secretion/activation protein n=1 Tax=Limnohabitans sp. T6-5 TaxID=1100724 RepID=UPI001E517D20|nr:ShlB/FhaC/HecB family hemolysin secretion/activation protein [Limnohabitans sp. T6-5]
MIDAAKTLADGTPDDPVGRCIGAKGIQLIIDRLQNQLIAQGFVTSRVLASPQNLQTGTLALQLVYGKVNSIQWQAPQNGAQHRATQWNTVPIRQGDILNLRDIEQALENFKRVPTAEADIQIAPASEPGYSDIRIQHSQPFPFRLNITADDSGLPSTGKYQGSATLSYDNWWTLSDLFYVTLNRDLGGSEPGARGTKGYTVHYSLPFGYWLFSATQSYNRYRQTVAGAQQDYLYSGTSRNTEVKLSRLIHRDAVGKTTIAVKGFQRQSNNFIDDTEVQVQRRVVGGFEWSLGHKRFIGQGSAEGSLSYRHGTGDWGSLPAPEEAFGEGTSRMRLWLVEGNLQQPLMLGARAWNYNGQLRAQYNNTPLTPQDRMAIGGRFSVRGFDGLSVLSAERGWVLRNEMVTPLVPGHQFYLGIDHGQVGGATADKLVGTRLTGAVLGLRGQLHKLQYDAFIGQPLSKPEQFKTASYTAGFTASLSF